MWRHHCAVASLRSGITAQWRPCTVASLHSGFTAQWRLFAVASLHSGIPAQWRPCAVASLHSGVSSRWLYGTVASLHSGITAQWRPCVAASLRGGVPVRGTPGDPPLTPSPQAARPTSVGREGRKCRAAPSPSLPRLAGRPLSRAVWAARRDLSVCHAQNDNEIDMFCFAENSQTSLMKPMQQNVSETFFFGNKI